FEGPRPLIYYIHGGPQGQERPDFTWFSMPLIQYLTLGGFAVFVPNVRGSTGYGLSYTRWVDHDFGGKDRLDHVHAMTQVLPQIRCPLLVIQGKNDSRIIERESRDVVEQLQAAGKQADYLVFEDEGHDVLKYANRVTCYTAIAEFFKTYL